jgi:hypothetical protein
VSNDLIIYLVVMVGVFVGLPLLGRWFLNRFARREHGGMGQQPRDTDFSHSAFQPLGATGVSGMFPYDIDAAGRSVRSILGDDPGPAEVRAARAYILDVAFDPMVLPADLREQLGFEWTEHPLDGDPGPYLEGLLGDDPSPAKLHSARRYLVTTGYDPALLPGRVRKQLGMEWTEHRGSPLDKAVRGVSSLLGPDPGPTETASALRYLAHIGYDPTLLPDDLRATLGVAVPGQPVSFGGALT